MKKLLSHAGFTVMEVVLAMGIMLTLALASASLAKLSTDSNRYADRKNALNGLAQLTIENVHHANSCDKALGPSSGLNLMVDDGEIREPSATGGWPLRMKIPGINSGASMTGDILESNTLLPLKRLQVDELKLAEAVQVSSTATDRTYLAAMYLRTRDVGGIAHRPILVGMLSLTADITTGEVLGCETSTSASIQNTCTQMGCVYNPALTPSCKCNRTQVVCAAPGWLPVAFSADGLPDCRPIGGDVQCPANEFLIGVGLDWHKCGPAPTTTGPTPSSTATATPTLTPTPTPIPTSTPTPCSWSYSGGGTVCQDDELLPSTTVEQLPTFACSWANEGSHVYTEVIACSASQYRGKEYTCDCSLATPPSCPPTQVFLKTAGACIEKSDMCAPGSAWTDSVACPLNSSTFYSGCRGTLTAGANWTDVIQVHENGAFTGATCTIDSGSN